MEIDLLMPFKVGGGTVDYIIWGLVILIIGGLIAALIFGINWLLKFNKKVYILYPHAGGYRRIRDKARELKTVDGNTYWRFLKTRGTKRRALRVTPPDKAYIDIDNKGKECCTFEMINPDSPIPVHPKVKDPDDDTLKKSTISPDDRAALIDDIENTRELHKDKSFAAIIEKAMPMIAVVITVLMLVIFLNQFTDSQAEIVSKVDSSISKFQEVADRQTEVIEKQNELLKDIMVEKTRTERGGSPPE